VSTLVIWGVLSGIISALSYPPYIFAIFQGRERPERVSYLIWSLLAIVAFFSQLELGAHDSLWLPAVHGLGATLIFILSWRYGFGGLMKRDVLALLAVAGVLALWFLTDRADLAVYLIILIDAVGAGLTAVKAYQLPKTEIRTSWALTGLGGFLAIFAVGNLRPELLAYPIYMCVSSLAIILAIMLGRRRRSNTRK
jgi:hypothetical protein